MKNFDYLILTESNEWLGTGSQATQEQLNHAIADIQKEHPHKTLIVYTAEQMTSVEIATNEDTVKCTNCEWRGNEEELTLVEFDAKDEEETPTATEDTGRAVNRITEQPSERAFLKGCPNCLTDSHLMDIE